MTGRIRVDGETIRGLPGLTITLLPGGPTTAPNSSGYWTSRIADDRTFRIDSLDPNLYGIQIGGLPDGFYTKSIRAGENDVTYSGVDLEYGAPGQIDILVSPKAGLLSGAAQNPNTTQPPPALPLFWFRRKRSASGFSRSTNRRPLTSTAASRSRTWFRRVHGLCLEDVESSAWMDPDFMKPLEGKGESVSVGESAQVNVQVNLISADSEKEKPK